MSSSATRLMSTRASERRTRLLQRLVDATPVVFRVSDAVTSSELRRALAEEKALLIQAARLRAQRRVRELQLTHLV